MPITRGAGVLASEAEAMYTYIVERTQIYLSRRASSALAREAARTGRTRSQLIREAIERCFLGHAEREAVERALRTSAGAWKRRRKADDGAEYVERMRPGRLADRARRSE